MGIELLQDNENNKITQNEDKNTIKQYKTNPLCRS